MIVPFFIERMDTVAVTVANQVDVTSPAPIWNIVTLLSVIVGWVVAHLAAQEVQRHRLLNEASYQAWLLSATALEEYGRWLEEVKDILENVRTDRFAPNMIKYQALLNDRRRVDWRVRTLALDYLVFGAAYDVAGLTDDEEVLRKDIAEFFRAGGRTGLDVEKRAQQLAERVDALSGVVFEKLERVQKRVHETVFGALIDRRPLWKRKLGIKAQPRRPQTKGKEQGNEA